jgi:hypothetical protein
MTTGNFLGYIINNQHPELSKRKIDSLINIGIDEYENVYVYSPQSQYSGLEEVKCILNLKDAQTYIKMKRNPSDKDGKLHLVEIKFDVKKAVFEALDKDNIEAEKTELILNRE